MKFKQKLIAIFLGFGSLAAVAETVDLETPGTLGTALGGNTSITQLKVVGAINAADFDFINNSLADLTSLDLSEATINTYKGSPVLLNRTSFEANTIPDFALAGTKLTSITFPATLVSIGEGALSSSAIREIDLSGCVALKSIGNGAFSNCNNLRSVSVPATVTEIGENAFSRCDNLESASLASSAPIPAQAFAYCPLLSSVELSGTVTSIGEGAFKGCSSLTSFPFRAGMTGIAAYAFEASGLTSADMTASSINTIGDWAFAQCPALTVVKFSNSTRELGRGLFFEDAALQQVALPSGVTELPDYVFKGDNSIDTAAFLHQNIASIGNYAMKDMSHVETFSLPSSLNHIGDEGMAGWNALRTLNANALNSVPELGDDVWKGIDQSAVHLTVNHATAEAFTNAPQWGEFHIDVTSGLDDVAADEAARDRVKAWFEGPDLHVLSSVGIDTADLYDINGRRYLSVQPSDSQVVIDTADFNGRVYILKMKLSDGTPAAIKIAR